MYINHKTTPRFMGLNAYYSAIPTCQYKIMFTVKYQLSETNISKKKKPKSGSTFPVINVTIICHANVIFCFN